MPEHMNLARHTLIILLFAAAIFSTLAHAQTPKPTDPIVFAYFNEPGNQGILFALSRDGYTFTPLNDGQPWIRPSKGELMRDVYITRTPDGGHFRMVFTWDWHTNRIGTSESSDLIHWSPEQPMDLMASVPNTQNTWAPETYWDAQHNNWLILWASSIRATKTTPGDDLHLWATHTKDFNTFDPPQKFFDRGFPVIDATMFHRDLNGKKDVVMVLKDQTRDPLRYDELWTAAPTVDGPWGPLSGPINESWSEGPSVIQVGDKFIVYYDHYRPPNPRYEGVETTDWIHWTSVNDKMHFPSGAKHGSFFRVTEEEAQRLLARHDPKFPVPPVP